MPTRIRIVLASSIGLLVAALLALGRSGDRPGGGSAARAGLDNASCQQCHPQAWKEWHESHHRRAWSDDMVQATFTNFGFDRKCQSCHAPEPLLATGLGNEPALRDGDLSSGVNCLSCHRTADGVGVAALRDLPSAPCGPRRTPELAESRYCADCHTAIYKDWSESRYAVEKKTCQTCHMPAAAARPGGRSHRCLGGHDESLVRAGATMNCEQIGEELVVSVVNRATGHNFPGERHNRILFLQVVERNAKGEIALAEQRMIKGVTPFRGETLGEKIRVDETFEARFAVVEPPVTAEVSLLYKPFPWLADKESLVVHRREVKCQ